MDSSDEDSQNLCNLDFCCTLGKVPMDIATDVSSIWTPLETFPVLLSMDPPSLRGR